MPKLTTTKTAKAQSKTSPVSRTKPQPVIDESLWRSSSIREGTTISKTIAKEQYRVTDADLKGLPYKISEATVRINGKYQIKAMFLYQERDVERVAWRKHGGPEAFEAYLQKLRTTWNKKSHRKAFPEPASYSKRNSDPMVSVMSLPPDYFKPSPELLRIEQSFPSKWLWETCRKALDGDPWDFHYSRKKREEILGRAVLELGPYPERPTSLLPPSESVTAFRSVIARAPIEYNDEGMETHYDAFTGDEWCYWNKHYSQELFQALINVIKEHGTGERGWESVRWDVYDQYSRAFGGIGYRNGSWNDFAKDWLRGYLHSIGSVRGDQSSEIGKMYNSMLPVVSF